MSTIRDSMGIQGTMVSSLMKHVRSLLHGKNPRTAGSMEYSKESADAKLCLLAQPVHPANALPRMMN